MYTVDETGQLQAYRLSRIKKALTDSTRKLDPDMHCLWLQGKSEDVNKGQVGVCIVLCPNQGGKKKWPLWTEHTTP